MRSHPPHRLTFRTFPVSPAGANLTVAFVQENGTYVSNTISTGMSTIFPQVRADG